VVAVVDVESVVDVGAFVDGGEVVEAWESAYADVPRRAVCVTERSVAEIPLAAAPGPSCSARLITPTSDVAVLEMPCCAGVGKEMPAHPSPRQHRQ
jgi:hypothetical protein